MKETVTYNFKPILNWYRLFHLELVAQKDENSQVQNSYEKSVISK